eukprot:scaffold23807_cov23-Cyclotella_meneghiniana.AAC.1
MPSKQGISFVSCDRGSIGKDVLIENELCRNRALDGDYVFVELLSDDNIDNEGNIDKKCEGDVTLGQFMDRLGITDNSNAEEEEVMIVSKDESNRNENNGGESYEDNVVYEEEEYVINEPTFTTLSNNKDDKNKNNNMSTTQDSPEMWHDDQVQVSLWDPLVNVRRKTKRSTNDATATAMQNNQKRGKVICIIPPKSIAGSSELTPADESYRKKKPSRTIVGTLTKLPDG